MQHKYLYVFDLDDTLVQHDYSALEIYVRKGDDPEVYNTIPYKTYLDHGGRLPVLAKGYWYDFSDFRSTLNFMRSSIAIPTLINMFNECVAAEEDVFILTAREQFDDMIAYRATMECHGIKDADKLTICAGTGVAGKDTPARKKEVIRQCLNASSYTNVVVYEDSLVNIEAILTLKEEFPDVDFMGFEVKFEPYPTFTYHPSLQKAG